MILDFHEVVDMIYDTLVDNVGMSEHHKKLDVSEITSSSIAAWSGKIRLTFRDGSTYHIRVTEEADNG